MTMEEELQEADILWPEHEQQEEAITETWSSADGDRRKASDPIKIPSKSAYARRRRTSNNDDSGGGEDDDDDDGCRIPPHVIIGRRAADRMAFSVCVGKGRTLKGRDLSRVRNSILQMTGFLERT
ncbi:DUF584 domain containing protein [Musa troglodytarum]|uniref:DUF584 domain containing protein n=1 Tax=Musa troglodytarum TaxID=320322 RepID=A0A9E7KHT4_9LILI|nr:DUF584 domain containing protein [Musa troglodytarum]